MSPRCATVVLIRVQWDSASSNAGTFLPKAARFEFRPGRRLSWPSEGFRRVRNCQKLVGFMLVRPSAWNSSVPTGRILVKFGI